MSIRNYSSFVDVSLTNQFVDKMKRLQQRRCHSAKCLVSETFYQRIVLLSEMSCQKLPVIIKAMPGRGAFQTYKVSWRCFLRFSASTWKFLMTRKFVRRLHQPRSSVSPGIPLHPQHLPKFGYTLPIPKMWTPP